MSDPVTDLMQKRAEAKKRSDAAAQVVHGAHDVLVMAKAAAKSDIDPNLIAAKKRSDKCPSPQRD
jgi:hypothetical protein